MSALATAQELLARARECARKGRPLVAAGCLGVAQAHAIAAGPEGADTLRACRDLAVALAAGHEIVTAPGGEA